MLFGRFQDFGYEQAEAFSVVASRHHFRLWKAPFTFQGEPVWVGAGTHDIGFEKDQRNGKITHKIDPAVDVERDKVGASLQKAGKAKRMFYYLPSNPVQEAKNATAGSYHSDGRLLRSISAVDCHCTFAYSAFASFRIGRSESAFFQAPRKSW